MSYERSERRGITSVRECRSLRNDLAQLAVAEIRHARDGPAEQSIGTASGVAWLTAIAGALIMVGAMVAGQLIAALLAAPFEIFWIFAGWRIRKSSHRWAVAALIVHIMNWVGFALMRSPQTAIGVTFWEIVFLFAFINGSRATRAYPNLKQAAVSTL